MSGYAGDLFIRIRPDATGFAGGIQQQVRTTETGLVASGRSLGRSIGTGILGGFAAVGIAEGIAHQITAGIQDIARVQASTEAVRQEFGSASDAVLKFSETAISQFGATEHATLQVSARLGVLLHNLGIAPQRAAEMAVGLETVAAAEAKIRGVNPADFFANLPQALSGNLRSLKQLGFAFDQQQIKQEAVRLGLIRTVKDGINPAIKAQAIYGLVIGQLGDAQAKAALHDHDLAFQQNRLTAEWDHAREELTKSLLPALTGVAHFLADVIPPAAHDTQIAFTAVKTVLSPLADLVGGFGNAVKILLALKVVSVLKGWAIELLGVSTETAAAGIASATAATEIGGMGAASGVAATEVGALGTASATAAPEIEAAGAAAATAAAEIGLIGTAAAGAAGLLGRVATGLAGIGAAVAGSDIAAIFSGLGADFPFLAAIQGPDKLSAGTVLEDIVAEAHTTSIKDTIAFAKSQGITLTDAEAKQIAQIPWQQGESKIALASQQAAAIAAAKIIAAAQKGLAVGTAGAVSATTFDTGLLQRLKAFAPLQKYQQLQLDALAAQKDPSLQNDLKVAEEIQAIFDHRVSTTKLTGKKLFDLKQQDLRAQLDVTNIEQQIHQQDVAAANKRAQNAKEAQTKQEKALQQQVDLLKAQIQNPIDAEITRLQDQLNRMQRADQEQSQKQALQTAQREFRQAKQAVQIVGAVTPQERKDIAEFLAPYKQAVSSARRQITETSLSNRIGVLQSREQILLAPLNRNAKAGETQVELLREIRNELRRNVRRVPGAAPAKTSSEVPGAGAGRIAHTLTTTGPF